jgi:glycosyltransferase involved in cell wall biosynthesis
MRIGINLLYLIPGVVGGTETYAAGLLAGLARIDNENEFFIFVNQSAADWPVPENKNFIRVICPVEGPIRYRRYFFEQYRLSKLLSQYKIDLVHSLGYVCPLRSPCPSVVTIPDLNYIDIAHTIGTGKRLILKFFSTQAAKRADHVITISNFSKERFCQILKLPAEKVTVTLLSTNEKNNIDPSIKANELLSHYGIKEPYIVAFGGGAIHKNIPRLIQAFVSLKDAFPYNLVLIGHLPPNIDLPAMLNDHGLNNRLIATGYVPNSHVDLLLSHADLFVLPSLYEGFGIPLLEAQKAGVAVACSTAGSLPEVAGDSVIFFDPYSVDSIAHAIHKCLSNDNLRRELRHLGQENLKRFSWGKTALETLEVYRRVMYRVSPFRNS